MTPGTPSGIIAASPVGLLIGALCGLIPLLIAFRLTLPHRRGRVFGVFVQRLRLWCVGRCADDFAGVRRCHFLCVCR